MGSYLWLDQGLENSLQEMNQDVTHSSDNYYRGGYGVENGKTSKKAHNVRNII